MHKYSDIKPGELFLLEQPEPGTGRMHRFVAVKTHFRLHHDHPPDSICIRDVGDAVPFPAGAVIRPVDDHLVTVVPFPAV